MLRIKLLTLAMLAGTCTTAFAHPGHGDEAVASGPLHYLMTTFHLVEIGLLIAATVIIGWMCRRLAGVGAKPAASALPLTEREAE